MPLTVSVLASVIACGQKPAPPPPEVAAPTPVVAAASAPDAAPTVSAPADAAPATDAARAEDVAVKADAAPSVDAAPGVDVAPSADAPPAAETIVKGKTVPKRYDVTGATSGALEVRAPKLAWPGDEASLARFTRTAAEATREGVGLELDGGAKLYAWGVGGKAAFVRLRGIEGGLGGYWLATEGEDRAGALVANKGDNATYEGTYTLDGQAPDGAWMSGALVLTKAGERYDAAWTLDGVARSGVALEDESGLVACWSVDAKACAVAVYLVDPAAPGRWSGRVATSGEAALAIEALADAKAGTVSLDAPPHEPRPAAAECVVLCRDKGLCDYGAIDGCMVRDDASCSRAKSCPGQSGCVVADGQCRTAADAAAFCRAPQHDGFLRGCAEDGLCSYADGMCVAASDADCAAAEACTRDGRCHAKDGACVAASDDDCKRAKACSDERRCAARDGRCWVAASDAAACGAACTERGECEVEDGVCRARGEDACKRASACRDAGLCELDRATGRCIPSDEGCAAAAVCKKAEACTAMGERCRPATQAWCTYLCSGHDGSAQLGLCTASKGRCINPNPDE